jgi:CxxC motif-containing protein
MSSPLEVEKDLICVTCPMGCTIHVSLQDGQLQQINGQACKRGITFTEEEIRAPRRMLTTTVRVQNGILPLLPVRSRTPLPKDLIFQVAAILRAVVLQAPIREHQVVLANVLDSGIDIIASRALERCQGGSLLNRD